MAIYYTLFVLLSSTLFFTISISISFSPTNNYLINCGSLVDSTTVDNRRFIADTALNRNLFSSEIESENPTPENLPQIYKTARIFTKQAKYEFNIVEKGIQMVRLHFHRFNFKFDLNDVEFHVTVNEHVVLSNFTGDDSDSPRVKEFLIWVDVGKLVIRFIPTKLAYVNAIEVFSAPKDLIEDEAISVTKQRTEKFNGLLKQHAMEVVYRINVGGFKVTPFNDTLWRTWIPDDERFIKVSDGSSSKKVYFSGRIKYRLGGLTREVGPDNVYNTARMVKSEDGSMIPRVNMTWEFPVSSGYKYLIRLHFCDVVSTSLGMLYFNVYINGNLAYEDFDMSLASDYVLASPYYIDFVVDDDDGLGLISVSIGPSRKSVEHAVDAILNGIEIMKMNNTLGSLDGFVSAEEMILSRGCLNRRNLSLFMSMVALVCILMSLYIVVQRKKTKDGFGWLSLSQSIPEYEKSENRESEDERLKC